MLERAKLYLSRNKQSVAVLTTMIVLSSIAIYLSISINSISENLILKNGTSKEASQFILNNITSISKYILYMIVGATLIVLSLLFIFWIRQRRNETGVLLSIGKSKFEIISQYFIEIITITLLSVTIAIAPAKLISSKANQLVLSKVEDNAKYSQEANEKGIGVENLNLSMKNDSLNLKSISKMYGLTLLVVSFSTGIALCGYIFKSPKKILVQIS